MLLTDWRAAVMFGEKQVLVPAKSLVNDHSIIRARIDMVHYYHILFDRHEIIMAEDCPSESFYLSDLSLSTQDQDQREELLHLFPELCGGGQAAIPTARMVLKSHEASVLKAT